jgi:hypothetical protein
MKPYHSIRPSTVTRTAPTDGAIGQYGDPTRTWQASANALGYYVCVDTTNNSACEAGWTWVGLYAANAADST